MNETTVKAARDEAKRFLKRVDDALNEKKERPWFYASKQTGALRRASLDLTRALAEMRRPS